MIRYVLVAVLCLVVVPFAHAQAPSAAEIKKLPQARISGQLQQVSNGVLVLKPDSGKEPVMVAINQFNVQTRVTILGTAEPEFIGPGMFVQFTAPIDSKGEVPGQLDKILLYEPTEATPPLLAPEGDPGSQKTNADGVPIYFVRGQVKGNKNGELMVVCPGKSVKVTIGPSTKIEIGLTNLALASPGDKVSIVGKEVDKTRVIGERVDVTLSAPLSKKGKSRR